MLLHHAEGRAEFLVLFVLSLVQHIAPVYERGAVDGCAVVAEKHLQMDLPQCILPCVCVSHPLPNTALHEEETTLQCVWCLISSAAVPE